MKAILTRYHPATDRRGSRYSASTGEKGQRVYLSDWGCENADTAHAMAARKLCERYGWKCDLIGGGFPDGTMVWVFKGSHDRTNKQYMVDIRARPLGALGSLYVERSYQVPGISSAEGRKAAIDRACADGLEHVTIDRCTEVVA